MEMSLCRGDIFGQPELDCINDCKFKKEEKDTLMFYFRESWFFFLKNYETESRICCFIIMGECCLPFNGAVIIIIIIRL